MLRHSLAKTQLTINLTTVASVLNKTHYNYKLHSVCCHCSKRAAKSSKGTLEAIAFTGILRP